MGVSIRKKEKGSGVWWIFIRHNNQRKAKKIGAKALAQKAKTIMEARLIANDLVFFDEEEEDKLLFKDCAKIWIKDVVPATCKNSTTVRYQSVLRKHLKQFNPTPIDEITRMDVKRFLLKKLSSGRSKSSVNYMKNALSGIFYVAIDSEVIQYNPTSGLRLKLTSRNSKPPVVPLNKQELNLLLNTFTVQRGVVIEDSTKNHKDRKVDMSMQLASCLKLHKKDIRKKAFAAGINNNLWLFPGKNWIMPLDKNSWRKRVFYKMLEKAGMRQIRIHDMRHTFASLLIQAGESLVYVKDSARNNLDFLIRNCTTSSANFLFSKSSHSQLCCGFENKKSAESVAHLRQKLFKLFLAES